ncbi:hypothetical protein QTO34_011993 [Cnephaeus nilssonii]|uniref:Uncharacterized protein n=1 Tax=Cnephaeus nilssonii TaxID=3371016 RepID=A0AA40HBW8_CNENI|nr:hypothetical protein QTO34_011993 [Eptesicus nilssonii]
MAEYKKPEAPERTEGPPAEPGWAQERPGPRGGVDRRRRSLKEGPEDEGPRKQASFAETSHGSNPASGKQLAETPGAATSPKLSSPLWALPPGAPDKQPGASPGPGGPGKKVSGTAEDEAKAFAVNITVQSVRITRPPGRTPAAEPGCCPNPPQPTRRKGPRGNPPGGERRAIAAQWGDHPHYGRSPLDVKRASSEKGASGQNPRGPVHHAGSQREEARAAQREAQPPWGEFRGQGNQNGALSAGLGDSRQPKGASGEGIPLSSPPGLLWERREREETREMRH